MLDAETVLVLAPHTDDGELGCGGTIARLGENGAVVHYVAFSICEVSVPEPFPSDILATEVQKATQTLNIRRQNLTIRRYPVRMLSQHRQEILEELVLLSRRLQPELVFLPATDDVHQDHQVVSEEGIRAFKRTTVLGYELPWNNLHFLSTAFIKLRTHHLSKKIEALQQYASQSHRDYFQEDYVRSIARVRGQQVGSQYAEAFQVIRWIVP
jgi:LmbE family N-acetylglucosaminyl deacetylase